MKTFSTRPGREETRKIPCPVCGLDSPRPGLACEGFAFVRCPGCKLMYQNPQPVPEALLSRYDHEYYEYEIGNEAQFFELMKLALSDVQFEKRTSRFRETDRSFLDIGCATGMLLRYMQTKGWAVQGVEVCEPAARYGRETRGVDIFAGTLETARFTSGRFTVVHGSHLIEHLTDPVGFVEECHRVLRDDGYFVLTTPNASGFQAKLFRSSWRSAIADHMALFPKRTLFRLLEEHGFEVIDSKTWGGIAFGLAPPRIKWAIDRLAKRFEFGDVVVVLARKLSREAPSFSRLR